jgi:hypothetical protein
LLDFIWEQQRPVPSWLRWITKKDVSRGPAPWLPRFLSQAIVYPGSGIDVSPIRQLEGTAHAFLFLDFGVRLDQITDAIQAGFMDQHGCPTCRLLAMVEFDAAQFIVGATVHAPQPPADWQHHRFGVWVILNLLDGGGRVALMILGAEAINALSALYPVTPPKGLVIQEHGFDCNPWGNWSEPITCFADEHWAEPPERLILGKGQGRFCHWFGDYDVLGDDEAVESMHGDWRVIKHLLRE